MIYHSSLTPIIISLFRASLLFAALLSTFYVQISSSLPIFSELVVSFFLFLNIFFACKKMTSHEHERVVQLHEQDASTKKRVQSGDSNVLDHGPRDCTIIRSSFEPDSIFVDEEKMTLEDVEEDYLIEIPLLDQGVSLKENERHNLEEELLNLLPQSVLQQQDLDEFLSDMNDVGGEDNLIEIDISMGSIRHSVTG